MNVTDKTCANGGGPAQALICRKDPNAPKQSADQTGSDDSNSGDPGAGGNGGSGSSGSHGGQDAGAVDAEAGDAWSEDADADSPEYVEGTVGGEHVSFSNVINSSTADNGDFRLYANDGMTGGKQLDFFFAPKAGASSCAAGDEVIFFALTEAYETTGTDTSCNINVTQFGPVGGWIDGTFDAQVGRNGAVLQLTGSFHVIRHAN